MRRHFVFALVLLLSAAWAQAQKADQGSYPQSNEGKSQVVQGCLKSANGGFTLTDHAGSTYQVLGDTSKLSEHIGHEVQITGPVATVTSSTSTSTAAPAGSSTIQVQHLKHISKTCTSPGK
jgi:hypothetical protein